MPKPANVSDPMALKDSAKATPVRVKVDGEEAFLHITDQSVMFEKGGRVSGFERSAIRMAKPDGDAMIMAHSVGSEAKSTRGGSATALARLLTSSLAAEMSSDGSRVPSPLQPVSKSHFPSDFSSRLFSGEQRHPLVEQGSFLQSADDPVSRVPERDL